MEAVTNPSPSAYPPSVRVSPTTLPSTEHVTKQATTVRTVLGVQATDLVTLAQLVRIKGSNPCFFFLSDRRNRLRRSSYVSRGQNVTDFIRITVLSIRQI